MATRSKLAVILHADVVGSTALVRKDESVAHDRIQTAFQIFSQALRLHGGTVHEIRGDALVAEFSRASDAVLAAVAAQQGNADRNAELTDAIIPQVRVGIALGEVVIADGTLTGAGVVLAQRLEQLANPGGVCISAAVREAVPDRLPLDYAGLGAQDAKGFDEPVVAYTVSLKPGEVIPEPSPPIVEVEVERPKRHRLVAVVVAFMLIVGGLLSWLQPWGPDIERADPGKMANALPDKPSITVLPFDNMSTDKEQDYFSKGVSEDISTDLTKISGLFVAPRTIMSRYKGNGLDLRRLSNEVGVRYILEGSVRRAQDRLRISAQLYDARTDQQVWAERYDRDIKDLFAVQDDISEKVVAALSAKLATRTLTRVARTYTPNVDAYDLYIRGRATRIPPTPDNLAAASKLFEKTIAIDPGFSGGYAGASFTNVLRYGRCTNSCERLLDAALDMANKAVSLDSAFGPGHGSLAEVLFRRGELDEALSAIQKAVEAAPNDSLMRASYGRILGHAGRFEEGIQQVKQALRMSPDSLPLLYYLGSIYRVAGRFEEAIDALMEHRKRLGGRVLPGPTAQLAAAYMQSGREAEARATVQELLRVEPRFSVVQASRTLGFKSKEASAQFLGALRTAGLPDH